MKEIKEQTNENFVQINLVGKKYQSLFITSFLSERGDNAINNDYLTYIELDNYACWIAVDGNNGGIFQDKIAAYVGESLIEDFIANPTINKKDLERMIVINHKRYRIMQEGNVDIVDEKSSCSIAMFVTDYTTAVFASVGNTRYFLLRDGKIIRRSKDDSLGFLMYETGKILYDEIRFRKDKNILTQKFGVDRSIKPNVSTPITLFPNDKVLLMTQGAWENLDEEDIEEQLRKSSRVGQWIGNLVKQMNKNCYLSLGNYTLCGVFINKPIPLPPKPIREKSILERKILKNGKIGLKLLIAGVIIAAISFGGIKLAKAYEVKKEIKSLYEQAEKEENIGIIETNNKKYDIAIESYKNTINIYKKLEEYDEFNNKDKIKTLENTISQLQQIKVAEEYYLIGLKSFKANNFEKSISAFKEADKIYKYLKINNDIAQKTERNLIAVTSVNEAYKKKINADELYLQKGKSKKEKNQIKKEALDIYNEVAPIFLQVGKNDIYNEIMEKVNKKEVEIKTSTPLKSRKTITEKTMLQGDKEFNEFKYYNSLATYQKALKQSKNSKVSENLKGKIQMNSELLIAVKLEQEGDKYLEKKDRKKANKKYQEALIQNKTLENNLYMPKKRYVAIINRLENKLKNLK